MEKWISLTKSSIESLVYLLCFKPRTQNEVAKIIYGNRSKQTNIEPVIHARRALVKKGYLEVKTNPIDLRSSLLIAISNPFVEYVVKRLNERSINRGIQLDKDVLSEDDRIILKKILDSNWFRESFFTEEYVKSRLDPEFNIQDGRLHVSSAFQFLVYKIEQICTLAFIFNAYLPGLVPHNNLFSDLTFDEFIDYWYDSVLKKKINLVEFIEYILPKAEVHLGYSKNLASRKPLDKKTRKELIYEKVLLGKCPALCFPIELSQKLMYAGRIAMTERNVFDIVIRRELNNFF